jgi:16S rRNA (cytosine1402-N4)-methyltransferase
VLAAEVLALLAPADGGVYLDATFGAGGHTQRILASADCRVIALDRDPTAIANAAPLLEAGQGRLLAIESRFGDMEAALDSIGVKSLDGVLIDLGVSSMQLDQAARGFSFRRDGPLDMRMGDEGPTAADVVAAASEGDLAAIVATLGEERFARPVARAIVARRQRGPIRTTRELAETVETVVRGKPGEIHPATRTFQALRMFVNEELDELAAALAAAESVLNPGGRLAVIAFHSLEDRVIKKFLSARGRAPSVSRHLPLAQSAPPSFRVLTPKAIVADAGEIAANPRSRSAKLRAAERTDAPASDSAIEALPRLPPLADVLRGR